jgi:hypothetical protein
MSKLFSQASLTSPVVSLSVYNGLPSTLQPAKIAPVSDLFLYISFCITLLVASPVPTSPVPTSTPIAAWPIASCAARPENLPPDNGKRLTYSPAGAASSPVTPAKAAAPAAASAPAAAKPATPVQAAKPAGPLECRVTCRTDAISGRRMFLTRPHPNKSPY